MKYCAYCGKELNDNADVCIGCGCSTRVLNTSGRDTVFCTHCGKEISAQAAVCVNCGCAVKPNFAAEESAKTPETLLKDLSEKMKINAIIWLCIAGVQIIAGIYLYWILIIPGVLNIISGIMDLKYSKEVLTNPVGIVKKFEPLFSPIITLAYNAVIGGVVGIAGSLYYLFVIRKLVMDNRSAFDELEMNCRTVKDKSEL